jgi:hypothetical protein
MGEPRRVEDAVLDILIDRLWQDGELRTVLASVWAAGYREGHIDGLHGARFTAIVAEEEQ